MAYDERSLRGVGGWLAFFILVLAVFGPIGAILKTVGNLYGDPAVASAYGDNWIVLQSIEWTVVAASIAVSLYLSWRVYAVHVWRSVQLTIAGLWLIVPITQLIEMIVVSAMIDVDVGALLALLAPEMAKAAAGATLWTAYLLRSRRVANTYARHPASDELEAVFD